MVVIPFTIRVVPNGSSKRREVPSSFVMIVQEPSDETDTAMAFEASIAMTRKTNFDCMLMDSLKRRVKTIDIQNNGV